MKPGDRFGRLTVLGASDVGALLPRPNPNGPHIVARCDCGQLVHTIRLSLENGSRTECLICADAAERAEVARLAELPYWKNRGLRYGALREYRKALRAGLIERAEVCERCGSTSELAGHHEDYAKPLEVVWLCHPCHGIRHGELGTHRRALIARHSEAAA